MRTPILTPTPGHSGIGCCSVRRCSPTRRTPCIFRSAAATAAMWICTGMRWCGTFLRHRHCRFPRTSGAIPSSAVRPTGDTSTRTGPSGPARGLPGKVWRPTSVRSPPTRRWAGSTTPCCPRSWIWTSRISWSCCCTSWRTAGSGCTETPPSTNPLPRSSGRRERAAGSSVRTEWTSSLPGAPGPRVRVGPARYWRKRGRRSPACTTAAWTIRASSGPRRQFSPVHRTVWTICPTPPATMPTGGSPGVSTTRIWPPWPPIRTMCRPLPCSSMRRARTGRPSFRRWMRLRGATRPCGRRSLPAYVRST